MMFELDPNYAYVREMEERGYDFRKAIWYLEGIMVGVTVNRLDLFDIEFLAGKKDRLFNPTFQDIMEYSSQSTEKPTEDDGRWMSPMDIEVMFRRVNNFETTGGRARNYIRGEYDRSGNEIPPLITTELSVRKLAFLIARGASHLSIPSKEVLKLYLTLNWVLEQFAAENSSGYNAPNKFLLKMARAYDKLADSLYAYARWDLAAPKQDKPLADFFSRGYASGFNVRAIGVVAPERRTMPSEEELAKRISPLAPFSRFMED